MRATHRQADQGRCQAHVAAIASIHGQPRAPPQAGLGLVDAHTADHLVRHAADAGGRHDGLRAGIDGVDVIAVEQALLGAENGLA